MGQRRAKTESSVQVRLKDRQLIIQPLRDCSLNVFWMLCLKEDLCHLKRHAVQVPIYGGEQFQPNVADLSAVVPEKQDLINRVFQQHSCQTSLRHFRWGSHSRLLRSMTWVQNASVRLMADMSHQELPLLVLNNRHLCTYLLLATIHIVKSPRGAGG